MKKLRKERNAGDSERKQRFSTTSMMSYADPSESKYMHLGAATRGYCGISLNHNAGLYYKI